MLIMDLERKHHIFMSLVTLLALSGQNVSGVTSRSLINLGNSANLYQARCSLPCTGSYSPGTFNVTFVLDTICTNITTSHFAPTQFSPSAVWILSNIKTISASTSGQCVIDVQFSHTSNTIPEGTCRLGREIPTDCTMPDETGPVLFGWMTCDDVIRDQFDSCYNQTTFSKCCHACNTERFNIADCPFGDFRPWSCTSLSDERCYNTNVGDNCCKTCHDIETDRASIPDCPYGDRDPYFCSPDRFQVHQCYNQDYKCCDTCYWEADDTQPECRYGDRFPGMCNSTVISDCYNPNIQYDCCRTCALLRNDQKPDCLYGDRFEYCANIQRRECYKAATEDSCCETCEDFSDNAYPDCKYGDRRDCYDININDCNDAVTRDECCQSCRFLTENDCPVTEADYCWDIDLNQCYQRTTRRDCCYTCLTAYTDNPYLSAEGCQYGDRYDGCYNLVYSPHQCYNDRTARRCCETCYFFEYNEIEECKYGDRTPNECWNINSTDCYDADTEVNCCETCHYNQLADLPHECRYGDRDSRCYTNDVAPWECYDQAQADICCETCSWHEQEDELGYDCRYGDRRYDCYNESDYICYDPSLNKECCKFCHNKRNDQNVGCEYGDRIGECSSISPQDCYNLENDCCETCPRMVSIYHKDIPDCKYGDRKDCSDITVTNCRDAEVQRKCCETCWFLSGDNNNAGCSFGDISSDCPSITSMDCYSRETECCQTCSTLVVQDTGHCKYGDRRSTCNSIEPFECYDQTVAYDCCYTCSMFRRTDLPYICQYGDRLKTCAGSQHHPSECYNIDVRDICCETCPNFNTGVRGCEYGDKDVRCDAVHQLPISCYNITVHRTCCNTCPSIANKDKPGCEYGDKYEFCQVSSCNKYSSFRLNECCQTCWDYVHTVTSTPRPSSSSSTSTATPVGNPDKQSSTPTPISSTVSDANDYVTVFSPSASSTGYFSSTIWPSYYSTITSTGSYSTTRRPGLHSTTKGPSYSTTRRPISYSTTRRPISYSTTRKPFPHSTTRRPISYSTTRRPISYSTTRRPISYSSTRRPISYSTTRRPISYSTTRRPISYSTTRRPISYSTTRRPISYSTTRRPISYSTTTSTDALNALGERFASVVPIVAGSVGGVLFVALLIIVCCYCMRRQRGPKTKSALKQQNGLTLDGLGRDTISSRDNINTASVTSAPSHHPPRRPDAKQNNLKKDEEVYDYIDDRDVRSLPSVRKPAVPFRDGTETEGAAYFEPLAGDNNSQYLNPAYQSDASLKDEHPYHVLEKQNDVGHEYFHM